MHTHDLWQPVWHAQFSQSDTVYQVSIRLASHQYIYIYKWYRVLGIWPHHYLCLQISLCAIIVRGVPSVLMRPFHLASDHLGPMMASETWHIRISIGTILWWCYTIARTHNTRDKRNVEPTNVNLCTQKTPTAPLLPYS